MFGGRRSVRADRKVRAVTMVRVVTVLSCRKAPSRLRTSPVAVEFVALDSTGCPVLDRASSDSPADSKLLVVPP
jgi:hypothetical protein